MNPLFRNILVPLDNSDHSRRALDVAIQIGKKFSGKITLIHVYSVSVVPVTVPEPYSFTSSVPVVPPAYVSKLAEASREAGRKILEEGKKKAEAEKVEVGIKLEEGHAVQEIVKASKEGNFELIVMGARGVSHVREMLLGSTTDGVMHHVACPVLIIR
ncbi:MAG: universal stress protein [Candidatus Bathyarchaeota archaeon]|nr:universal stress protein [Candidatus Bathyarchaeota archaeon]